MSTLMLYMYQLASRWAPASRGAAASMLQRRPASGPPSRAAVARQMLKSTVLGVAAVARCTGCRRRRRRTFRALTGMQVHGAADAARGQERPHVLRLHLRRTRKRS